jgi:hypothetical protein
MEKPSTANRGLVDYRQVSAAGVDDVGTTIPSITTPFQADKPQKRFLSENRTVEVCPMPEFRDMPVSNEQFDKVVQHLAKALVMVGNNLTSAIERHTQAILTQTIETLKAHAGHTNTTTSVDSIVKSVEGTFSRLTK